MEKFLEKLAKDNNITVKEANKLLKKCIMKIGAENDMQYSEIFNIINNEEFMEWCLRGSCDKLTLEQCKKSCHCVEYYDEKGTFKCVSKIIPNVHIINADPDKYINTFLKKTSDLKTLVYLASYLYFNYDGGGLTDNAYDALQYHLNKREKLASKKFEKVGAPPIEKIKTRLPYPMPSLTKVKPGTKELLNFISVADEISWSLKLDGVSAMAIYSDTKLKKLYTRGDGMFGGDVSYLKDYINIPKKISYKGDIVVRGEFIMTKEKWEKYKGTFSNSRNFVSSRTNTGYIAPGVEDIDFVAYKILKMDSEHIKKPSQALLILQSYGFSVVDNGVFSPTVFDIISLYKEKRNSSIYAIDGIVLAHDVEMKPIENLEKHTTEISSPTNTVAFKMQLEEQVRSTSVLDVEWNISRYGKYIPVVIYESVYVNGVRMHRATGHNAAHIRDWNMGKGTQIKVVRSGDVIPTITDVIVDKNIKMIPPPITYDWVWQGKHIILKNIDTNRDVQIARIVYFFETIGVPKLREKTAEKMWEAGMKNAESIAGATVKDFLGIRGIGKKTAQQLYDNIHNIMRKTPIDRYLVASSTFASGIGRKLIKDIFREVPNIFEMSKNEIATSLKKQKIKGFGPKRIENIAESMPKFRDYLYSFAKNDIQASINYNKNKRLELIKKGPNPKIKGKIFVFTGFFGNIDYDLEDYIYDNEGDFSKEVSSTTEAVVAKNILDITGKMEKAQKLNIQVLSLEEFLKKYK